MKRIKKILVANRGEIACRVMRTCKKLGINTVAVYSESDANSLFVKLADEALFIGSSEASQSYLNIDKLIHATKTVNADAIHPCYGFLSENAAFAERCEKEGIIFIGPKSSTIECMGSKQGAKKLLSKSAPSVPLIPGYNGDNQDVNKLMEEAISIGFPVLIKASAGGGGKGMRIVYSKDQLKEAIDSAKSEAINSFGNDLLLIEKYFESVKHIEFQLFGDNYGNVVHLFERECSVQRRHQKVLEETPSVVMSNELREKMGNAAVTIGKLIGYSGAGTVEFIVDKNLNYYFLEVNTRLQVEHPVTEFVTGLDLVELQIKIAEGYSLEDLKLTSSNALTRRGHAIQCRLYAEDPNNNFFPCVGKVLYWKPALIENVRYDTAIDTMSQITVYYDPLISKIISYADTRQTAILKLIKALQDTVILGLKTNKRFLIDVLAHEAFTNGYFDTHFIQTHFPDSRLKCVVNPSEDILTAAFLWDWLIRNESRKVLNHLPSGWRNNPSGMQQISLSDVTTQTTYKILYKYTSNAYRSDSPHKFIVDIQANNYEVAIVDYNLVHNYLIYTLNNHTLKFDIIQVENTLYLHSNKGEFTFVKNSRLPEVSAETSTDNSAKYTAPMPGKVLKVSVSDGDEVKSGQLLVTLFSMKMEHKILAQKDGKVKVFVKEGDLADAGQLLVDLQ